MKKILVSIDFSDNAQNALDYALYLFEKEACTFYLLHAYHDTPLLPATKLTRKDELNQLLKHTQVRNNNPKHQFKTVIETDSVVNLINRTVIDNAVNFIFMGTKGYTTLHEVFLGSNTVDVIKHLQCACPIVAVPKDYNYDIPKEILFATDFKHGFIAPELMPLNTISKLWNSAVSVVHINTEKELSEDQKENKTLLRTSLKPIKSKFMEVKMKNSIASTIYRLEKENPKIGMVALLNTKHGFFKNLLREPIIKNMSFRTEIPLLVLQQIVE